MKCLLLAWRRIGNPTSGFVFLSRRSDRCCAPNGWKTDDGLSCSPSGWDQSITPCTAGARLTLKLSTLRESVYSLNNLHTPWGLFVWIECIFHPELVCWALLPLAHTHAHKYLSPLLVSFTFSFFSWFLHELPKHPILHIYISSLRGPLGSGRLWQFWAKRQRADRRSGRRVSVCVPQLVC